MKEAPKPDFSVILPAYNESKNLTDVLKNLRSALNQAKIPSEIIVVDNGSDDNTPDVLEALKKEIAELRSLRIEKNLGYGNGIIKGLAVARGNILCFTDADGQVRSQDLVRAYLKVKNNHLDLCKGTRTKRYVGLSREIISKIYNLILRLTFDNHLEDINGKPKVFTRRFYQAIKPVSKDWFLDTEIMFKAQSGKYAVGDIPIIYQKRRGGGSKVRLITIFEFLKNIFYWRLFLWNKK